MDRDGPRKPGSGGPKSPNELVRLLHDLRQIRDGFIVKRLHAVRTHEPVFNAERRWAELNAEIGETVGPSIGRPQTIQVGGALTIDWLRAPSVRVRAVNKVVVTPAHDATLSIEFEFQRPGSGQPLVLMQKRGSARESLPARFGAHTITFDGGIAAPEPDVASALARDLRLPEAFVAWPGLSKAFARPGAQTTLPMRRAIQSLRDAASSAMEQVIGFFYPDLGAVAARGSAIPRSRESEAPVPAITAIVLDIEGLDEATRIRLWWPGGTPDIDSIAVVIDGQQTEPARPATWTNEDRLMQVQVDGINVDPDALASAALTAGVLRLEFTAEPDASSPR